MITQILGVRPLVAALGALGIPLGLSAQTAAPDPWRRVPGTPTSCYAASDFEAKVSTAIQDNLADLNRQEDLNQQLNQRLVAMDPAEKAQRMQAYMMKDPQAAMKMLQNEQAVSASGMATLDEVKNTAETLDKQLADHKKAFDAAVDHAVKPVVAKLEALVETRAKGGQQRARPEFAAAADQAQYVALVQDVNAAYETACAPYFGAKGAFHSWLERYRSEIVDRTIAISEAGDAVARVQLAILETPAGSYRSTAKLRGVRDYLDRLYKVTGYRRPKATTESPFVHK